MKLALAVFICLNVSFAQEWFESLSPVVYNVTNKDISRFFCSRSNVFIMETCMHELNNCVDGYMTRRFNLSEGTQLMSAIEFCSSSLLKDK